MRTAAVTLLLALCGCAGAGDYATCTLAVVRADAMGVMHVDCLEWRFSK